MMKTWIVALLVCLLSSAAMAQTGSAKTATAINTEINNTLATGLSPPISASALRQVVLDIVATAYSLVDVANPSAPTLTITGATALTTSQPVLSMTQTWVTLGTTYTGILFNVTNTNSAAASLLLDLQVGGITRHNIDKFGGVTFSGTDDSNVGPKLSITNTTNARTMTLGIIDGFNGAINGPASGTLNIQSAGATQMVLNDGSPVQFSTASQWTANGAVATALTSVGPTGSHTTVQTWFTVKDSGGTVRYIPGF